MQASPIVASILIAGAACAAHAQPAPALPLRTQAQAVDAWLEHRLDTLLPTLMTDAGIEMWVLISREYNEDPVVRTMLPATWLSARRRTILVLHQAEPNGPVERLAVARYAVGDAFEGAWEPESQPDQWARLREIIAERNPASIGVNTSRTLAHADGLVDTERDLFVDAIGSAFAERIVSAETLAMRWLETRTAPEVAAYTGLVRSARAIIHEALSEQAVTPGVTTTKDLEWWLRERARALGYDVWFHPSVAVQRPERTSDFVELFTGQGETINPGDLVHIDFGITSLGLNTDTQQMAYVLRPGESEAPQGVRDAIAKANRLQDILTSEFATGRTGNEILARTLQRARDRSEERR
ncbi:MAG: M24 family metallopeptidase, partial [Phycisphaerales bacterium]